MSIVEQNASSIRTAIVRRAYLMQQASYVRFDREGVRSSVEAIAGLLGKELPEHEMEQTCDAVLEQQRQSFPIHRGQPIVSIRGESDLDERDNERHTGPNAVGVLLNRDDRNGQWSVAFSNGTSVWISDGELADAMCYRYIYLSPDEFESLAKRDARRGDNGISLLGFQDGFHRAPGLTYSVDFHASAGDDFEPDNSGSEVHGEIRIHVEVQVLDEVVCEYEVTHEGDRTNLLKHLSDHQKALLAEAHARMVKDFTASEAEESTQDDNDLFEVLAAKLIEEVDAYLDYGHNKDLACTVDDLREALRNDTNEEVSRYSPLAEKAVALLREVDAHLQSHKDADMDRAASRLEKVIDAMPSGRELQRSRG